MTMIKQRTNGKSEPSQTGTFTGNVGGPDHIQTKRTLNLFYVDDEPMNVRTFKRGIVGLGNKLNAEIKFDSAESGQAALDKLLQMASTNSIPNICVFDCDMPNSPISGIDLLSQIRKIPELSAVPVIIYSGIENQKPSDNIRPGEERKIIASDLSGTFILKGSDSTNQDLETTIIEILKS